jgi:carboxyl-terminal processing protease
MRLLPTTAQYAFVFWNLAVSLALSADRSQETYVKDVDFLLQQLPQQAGGFFKIKGIDWHTISNRFQLEVQSVSNDVQHVKLCQRLLGQLKDGHARLTDLKVELPDESRGRRRTGPRVHLVVIAERVYVRQAFGSALERGVEIGSEVIQVDGVPAYEWLAQRVKAMSDESGYSTAHQALYAACHWGLADWQGTPIIFDLLKNGRTNSVTIVRSGGPNFAPIGPIFPPQPLEVLGRQSYGRTKGGFGYIHLRDVPGNLPEQLDTMLEKLGELPGLILDMRANGGGGCDHDAVFGRFVPTGTKWRHYPSAGKKPFSGPMVVIVDAGTRSAGETVAGMFKEDGRAYMIGDSPTAGTSSSKSTLPVPSGLFAAYFSVRSNMGRFNNGRGIEGIGVPPHEVVAYDAAELGRGVDTQIRRAEELLKRGLPKDEVPYANDASR